MALGEFSLIDRFFKSASSSDGVRVGAGIGINVGIGDDAAVMTLPADHRLVVCKDVLVQGRHFFPDVAPDTLGHKCLAVNLSDLAAMGATPIGCLLGIGLPKVDETWLGSFADGFNALANRYQCPLIGGDTVGSDQGLFISVTALGALPIKHTGLLRSAAQVDDDIWISGSLGAADLALRILQGTLVDTAAALPYLRTALEQPEPRVELGQHLLGVAHAAIDISDGLAQDLSHVLKASEVGAVLELDALPAHSNIQGFNRAVRQEAMLYGGDVYELCFTASPQKRLAIEQIGQALALPLTRVGTIRAQSGLLGLQGDGSYIEISGRGFDHFSGGQP